MSDSGSDKPVDPVPAGSDDATRPPDSAAGAPVGASGESYDDLPGLLTPITGDSTRKLAAAQAEAAAGKLAGKVPDFSRGSVTGHVLRFGSPLVVAMAFMAAFNLIDIFIVGRLEDSHEAVTIVSICDALLTLFVVLCTGIGNAAIAFISRAVGKRDTAMAQVASMHSIYVIIVVSVLVAIAGLVFPGQLLQLLGVGRESRVYDLGVSYLQVAFGGGFTMFFVVHLTAILRGAGNSFWPTLVLVVVNVLNILLAIVLVLGPEQGVDFGFGWGVIGAAWAALYARIVGFAICILIFTVGMGRHFVILNPARWTLHRRALWKLLRIGLPSSGQLIVRVLAILGLIGLIFSNLTTDWDTTVGTAYALCSKLDLIALFMALGWGQGAASLVGYLLGAGQQKRAERVGWVSMWVCTIMIAVISVVFVIFAAPVVNFFFVADSHAPADIATGADPETVAEAGRRVDAVMARAGALDLAGREAETLREVRQRSEAMRIYHEFFTAWKGTPAAGVAWQEYKRIEHELVVYHGVWYLRVMVVAWIVMGIGIVLSQAMTGAGDTRTPVVLDFVVLIAILLPAVALLLNLTPLRQRSVWVTIGLGFALLAGLYAVAFRRGRWKQGQL